MSYEFVKRIGIMVSSRNIQKLNETIEKEASEFSDFLISNEIILDEFIDHVLDAYSEGGLVAAS